MKNIIVPIVLLFILTSIGCANDETSEAKSIEPVQETVVAPTLTPTTGTPVIADTNANKIKTVSSNVLPITIPSNPASSSGLNPAHGQPGHRCELAVGAPLDSKPAQPTIQSQPVTPTSTTTTTPITATPVTTTPSSTGKGLNPAHGQPGHRCEIAVGAPLDSKPIQTTIQTPPITATPTQTNVTPVTPTQVKPATSPFLTPSATGKGLNPAHGQPGHRCDISVGAPLDSKPAK